MSYDLDVVLAAHGSGEGSDANALAIACARQLAKVAVGARVRAAFVAGQPSWSEALKSADRPQCLVIPLLASDGYFASRLRHHVNHARAGTLMSLPIGSSATLVRALIEQVTATIAPLRGVGTNLIILVVGHGTVQHAGSAYATRAVASALAGHLGLPVTAVFLDETPTIEEVLAGSAPDSTIVVVPFLLGGGQHVSSDIPARLAKATPAHGWSHRLIMLDPLGGLPALGAAIESCVREARPGRTLLTAAARDSRLSRRQVELAASRLHAAGVDVRFVPVETLGDIDQQTPIGAFVSDGVFTDAIDDALRAGQVDVAVHSFKDRPIGRGEDDIVDAAFLPRASAAEVLVSRDRQTLRQLPRGARIGTSCDRRAAQLRAARPDLVPVPIRGAVPHRLAAVDRGEYDAVVLAEAGLERLGLLDHVAQSFSLREFLPAPGQGAIVVQCRADAPCLPLLRTVDHAPTRHAVYAERAFARSVAATGPYVTAAYASMYGPTIEMHARLIEDEQVRDVRVEGSDPEQVGAAAAEELLGSGASVIVSGGLR